jgi:hypothetical protein
MKQESEEITFASEMIKLLKKIVRDLDPRSSPIEILYDPLRVVKARDRGPFNANENPKL